MQELNRRLDAAVANAVVANANRARLHAPPGLGAGPATRADNYRRMGRIGFSEPDTGDATVVSAGPSSVFGPIARPSTQTADTNANAKETVTTPTASIEPPRTPTRSYATVASITPIGPPSAAQSTPITPATPTPIAPTTPLRSGERNASDTPGRASREVSADWSAQHLGRSREELARRRNEMLQTPTRKGEGEGVDERR